MAHVVAITRFRAATAAMLLTPLTLAAQPSVTLRATDPAAVESPADEGECELTRSGDLTNSLAVAIRPRGNASPGIDTVSFGAQAVFPPGEDRIFLTIDPIDDLLAEGPEALVIDLLSGIDYTVSPALAECRILLFDDEVGLEPRINELLVDGVASDDELEFVELVAQPGSIWSDLYLLFLEGDSGSGPGTADYVVGLSTTTFDDDGLLAIVDAPTVFPVFTSSFIPDSNLPLLENGALSILLVQSSTALIQGTDYDVDDDGVLELPSGAAVFDSLAWGDGGLGEFLYGEVVLRGLSDAPDAATRFFDSFEPDADSWYFGEHASSVSNTEYDLAQVSSNFPPVGRLTPTSHNLGLRIVFLDGFESGDLSGWQ